jgi:predicted alpha/beta hydrolase
MSDGQAHPLTAPDGRALAARVFRPRVAPRASLLIAPAMGVPQRVYAPLAGWLRDRGVAVLTLDYRGTGESRDVPLPEERADLLTWAHQDLAAGLAAASALAPDRPRLYLGHSLGGQLFPLVPGAEGVDRSFTVAAGSGWWRHNAPALRRKVWIFWWVAVPLLTPVFGYFPGRRLGMVGDLPAGAVRQWRTWSHHPDYLLGCVPGARAAYAAVQTPTTVISFEDDELLSQASVDGLAAALVGAPLSRRHHPRGARRIGHFGFFHPEKGPPLWEALLAPQLDAPAAPAGGGSERVGSMAERPAASVRAAVGDP